MELQFNVENLNIICQNPEQIVNDSTNYVEAIFSFNGEPWDKVTNKTAIFHQKNKAYSVILNNDRCYIPFEVLKNCGFGVGVSTSYEEDNVVKTAYTEICRVKTSISCYSKKFGNQEIVPSQYDQIMSMINKGITSLIYDENRKELIISSSSGLVYDEDNKSLIIGGD